MATRGSRAALAQDGARTRLQLRRALLGALALAAVVGGLALAYGATPRLGTAERPAPLPFGAASTFAPFAGTAPAAAQPATATRYAHLPLTFAPAATGSAFVARGAGYALALTPSGARVTLARAPRATATTTLTVGLAGARPAVRLSGAAPLPGRMNYLVGPRSAWRTDVRSYAHVRYARAWPGIDAVFYGTQSQLEYDFVVAPRADASRVAVTFGGTRGVRVARDGALRLALPGGSVRQLVPRAFQRVGGARRTVAARYVLRGDHVGIRVGAYDHARRLVIDPVLAYATYIGGNGSDAGTGIAVDDAGQAYVVGNTQSTDLPAKTNTSSGNSDAFITKLDAAGTGYVYTTYLGGTQNDLATGVAVDGAHAAYVVGTASSGTFAGDTTGTDGDQDGYLVKLAPDGSTPTVTRLYTTTSSKTDVAAGVALDSSGDAYVSGYSNAVGGEYPDTFSVPGYMPVSTSNYDAFIARIPASGPSNALTIGGIDDDMANGVAVDPAGNAYATGTTVSGDFPHANPSSSYAGGGGDAFVVQATPALDALSYSRFLGGGGEDVGNAIAVDGAGQAYVTGSTASSDLPTASALQAAQQGSTDAFVSKLGADGNIAYSTYLGGGPSGVSSLGTAIAVSGAGNAVVAGYTDSSAFPTQAAYQPSNAGGEDAYLAKLSPAGNALVSSTYFGGGGNDEAYGVAVGPAGAIYVAGLTSSTDFPTTPGAAAGAASPSGDAFAAKLSPPPTATTGGATPVATTTATLNGRVNPMGDGTTYHFGYGTPSGALTSTPDASAGSEDVERGRSAAISGLSPATTYRFRIVASNSGGTSTGAFQQFTTDTAPGQTTIPPPPAGLAPQAFQTIVIVPVSGTIRYRPPGSSTYIVLRAGQEIPLGSTIDATKGVVSLTSAASGGTVQTAIFYEGFFKTSQLRARPFRGDPIKLITQLALSENKATPKKGTKAQCASSSASARAAAKKRPPHLWGNGKGSFRTKGHYGSATVRGTQWYTENRARSTYVRVVHGVVAVADFARHRTVLVRAGHRLNVTAPTRVCRARTSPRFTG